MKGNLRTVWSGRTQRERALIVLAGALVVGWGVWAAAVQPLLARAALLEMRVKHYALVLPRVAALPPAAEPDVQTADPRPLPLILTEGAATSGIEIRSLEERDGAVTVQIDDAAFEGVMLWLETLEQGHRFRLTEITMTRREGPGIVGVAMTVAR